MRPAFYSTAHAIWLGALLLFFVTLPVGLHWIGHVSKEEAYRGISERAGAYDYIRRQIFEKSSAIDMVFCGNSLLFAAVAEQTVENGLNQALGRKSEVVMIPQSWQGPDMNYFVTRDLMERRRVKMLVIAAPARVHHQNSPHVQLFRVVRYGDHPGALDGLPLGMRLAFYADFVLGAPRQALSLFRANQINESAGRELLHNAPVGYKGGPFVPHPIEPPAIPPGSMVYDTKSDGWFRFDGPELNEQQTHFIRKTAELARQHGALLVILHMPSPSEKGMDVVPDRQGMRELLGPGVMFAGLPSTLLFSRVPERQFEDYFQDEHLNLNGRNLFTQTVTPMLVNLYERFAQR